jgi:hypothetical protein
VRTCVRVYQGSAVYLAARLTAARRPRRRAQRRPLELRQINLADALAIVLLMSAHQDPAYQRAARRWLTRLASERPSIGLQDLRIAVDALQALAGTQPAHAALAELCARHHVGDVIGLPAVVSAREEQRNEIRR